MHEVVNIYVNVWHVLERYAIIVQLIELSIYIWFLLQSETKAQFLLQLKHLATLKHEDAFLCPSWHSDYCYPGILQPSRRYSIAVHACYGTLV